MRAIKTAYKHLGDYIKTKVLDDDDNPVFKEIDLWNGQTEHVGDDGASDNDAIDTPALFIEFDVDKINTIGVYQVDLDVTITFYVAFDSLEDTKIATPANDKGLHFLELLSLLHEQIQGYTNENSGSLDVASMRRYKTRSNLIVYMITYTCMLRDASAFDARRDTVTTVVNPEIVVEVVKRPHTQPNKNGDGGTFFDLST